MKQMKDLREIAIRHHLLYQKYIKRLIRLEGLDSNIIYTTKKNGEFGYYVSDPSIAIEISSIMKLMKLYNICDLGSGCGILIDILRIFDIMADGFEIEDSLINIEKNIFNNGSTYKKDLLSLSGNDLKKYDCLFFWEPFSDYKLCKRFVKVLERSCSKNQYIFYLRSGQIGQFLEVSKKFEFVEHIGRTLLVYKKL